MNDSHGRYWSGITDLASGAAWSVEVTQNSASRYLAYVVLESSETAVAPMTADETAELINALQLARRELIRASQRRDDDDGPAWGAPTEFWDTYDPEGEDE